MKRSYIFARRITAGKSGTPRDWDGVSDFSAWYANNKSATGTKGILKLFVTHDDDRTGGRLEGLILEVEGKAAKDIYNVRGANISVYLPSDTVVSGAGVNAGLHVEMQGGTGIIGDWYGAFIYSAPGAAPSGGNAVLRLEANVTADDRNDAWIVLVGGKGNYAMSFGPLQTQTAWSYTGSPSNQVGWVKVKIGLVDRWLMLYDTSP